MPLNSAHRPLSAAALAASGVLHALGLLAFATYGDRLGAGTVAAEGHWATAPSRTVEFELPPEPVLPPPQPEPVPEPAPELQEAPPQEPDRLRAGIDDSDADTPAWIGAAEATEHQAVRGEMDQAARSTDPGAPGAPGERGRPGSPTAEPAEPAADPLQEQAAPAVPPVQSPPVQPPRAEPRNPEPIEPRPEAPEPERPAESPRPEPRPADPDTPAEPLPPVEEPTAPGPAEPETPGATPTEDPPAAASETDVPNVPDVGDRPIESPAAGEDDLTRPGLDLTTPGELPDVMEALPAPDAALRAPPLPRAFAESLLDLLGREDVAALLASPAEPSRIATEPARIAAAPPGDSGSGGDGGGGGAGVGTQSAQEAEAFSTQQAVVVRPGEPLAAKGLQINTVRPRWSTTTQLLAARPKDPKIGIIFGRDGRVKRAQFLDGQTTGYPAMDDPLLDAVYRWTATGAELRKLSADDPDAGVSFVVTIILR